MEGGFLDYQFPIERVTLYFIDVLINVNYLFLRC